MPGVGLISPRSQTAVPKRNLLLLGWLRPVLERNGDKQGAAATIRTHGNVGKAHSAQRMAELAKRRDFRVRAGHLPERVVVERQLAALQSRPRNAVPRKPIGEERRLEGAPLVDTVGAVDIRDERILNVRPSLLAAPRSVSVSTGMPACSIAATEAM